MYDEDGCYNNHTNIKTEKDKAYLEMEREIDLYTRLEDYAYVKGMEIDGDTIAKMIRTGRSEVLEKIYKVEREVVNVLAAIVEDFDMSRAESEAWNEWED